METNITPAIQKPAIPSLIDALRSIGMTEVATNVFSIPTVKKKKK